MKIYIHKPKDKYQTNLHEDIPKFWSDPIFCSLMCQGEKTKTKHLIYNNTCYIIFIHETNKDTFNNMYKKVKEEYIETIHNKWNKINHSEILYSNDNIDMIKYKGEDFYDTLYKKQ